MSNTSLYEMSPADNVLYFPNNVDVRLCPKNGMSTLKELYRLHRGHDEYIGRSGRLEKVRREGNQFDIPFRKDSFRLAVRRDPIDRFKSACEYIVANRARHIRSGRGNELPPLDMDIGKVITSIEDGSVKNNHFYTQSWYMGSPEDYDIVVHISELDRLLVLINEASDLKLPEKSLNIHDNASTMKVYNGLMSEEQIARIHTLYEIDFKRGWCKLDDRI